MKIRKLFHQPRSFSQWNEFIHDGKKFSPKPMPSKMTITLRFLDKMLKENKIDEFEHQKLRVKVIKEYNDWYRR